MWSNKEADFFPEINKSFTFPGMGPRCFLSRYALLPVCLWKEDSLSCWTANVLTPVVGYTHLEALYAVMNATQSIEQMAFF